LTSPRWTDIVRRLDTSESSPRSDGRAAAALLLALALLATLAVFAIFVRDPGITGKSAAMFLDMVYGRAHRPFVYRALLPLIVRGTVAVVPATTASELDQSLARLPGVELACEQFGWERDALLEYAIALALIYASLVGFVFAIRAMALAFYRTTSTGANLAALLAVVGLPPFFRSYPGYLYDFPALLLFTLGLTLMAQRRWRAFLLVFLLGAINKETIVLLTLVFAIHFGPWGPLPRMDRRAFVKLLALQFALFVAVKIALTLAFHDNPGGFVEFHVVHNLALLRRSLHEYNAVALATGIVLALLVFARWRQQPILLRRGLVILPVLLVLTAFLGLVDELRDYYEAYPIAVQFAFANVAALVGLPATAREPA
jgi:hypothetical protein